MQDLEPPEVPLEMVPQTTAPEPKKGGFFRKLFSKKDQVKESSMEPMPNLPNMDAPKIDLPALEVPPTDMDANNYNENSPDLPTLTEQLEELRTDLNMIESGKIKNKSRGKLKKGQKKVIEKIDESRRNA